MRDIIDGFLRFQHDAYPTRSQLFKSLATQQAPKTLFIAYSDSRVVPELLTQHESGELFMIRNAGNIVPGYEPQPGGASASMEYAVAVLGAGDIVAYDHSDCDAMGTIASCAYLNQLPTVAGRLHNAEAARAMNSTHEHASEAARLDALVRHNMIAQLANLCTHPCVVRIPEQGRLNLHDWVYDIESDHIDALDSVGRCPVSLAEHPEVHVVGGAPGQAIA